MKMFFNLGPCLRARTKVHFEGSCYLGPLQAVPERPPHLSVDVASKGMDFRALA